MYWWRADFCDDEPELCEIAFGCVYQIEKQSEPLENYGGEWLGPISPSDFEQLIRLRKLATDALRYIETDPVLDDDGIAIVAALREALANTGEQS